MYKREKYQNFRVYRNIANMLHTIIKLKKQVNDLINSKTVLGNGNRICLHCQGVFTYKIHNHKYCSEDCRITAWELRTGKIFTKPNNRIAAWELRTGKTFTKPEVVKP